VATLPRFTSKTFSCSGGDVSTSLEFFSFYGGGWGEGRVLCVDEDGKVTVELMSGLVLPKRRWHDAVSISVIHGVGAAHDPAHPNALYVMDSKGHSLQALVYSDPDQSPYRNSHMYVWHWRQLPLLPVDDKRHYIYLSAQCYELLHGHGGDEDATRSRSDTICVSFSRLCAKRAEFAPTGTGTYCFDNGTGEWTKAGNWRLPFWSHVLHVPELGDGLLFGIENKHHHRFCVMHGYLRRHEDEQSSRAAACVGGH
jgi:hypothetical protein